MVCAHLVSVLQHDPVHRLGQRRPKRGDHRGVGHLSHGSARWDWIGVFLYTQRSICARDGWAPPAAPHGDGRRSVLARGTQRRAAGERGARERGQRAARGSALRETCTEFCPVLQKGATTQFCKTRCTVHRVLQSPALPKGATTQFCKRAHVFAKLTNVDLGQPVFAAHSHHNVNDRQGHCYQGDAGFRTVRR